MPLPPEPTPAEPSPAEPTAPVLARPEARHPRTLPPLSLNLSGRTVVLLLDANVVMRDLHAAVKTQERAQIGGRPAKSALFELLHAQHGRLVMSAADLADLSPGVSRLAHNIREKFPAHAEAMLALWERDVRPRVLLLDPAGLPDTALSAEVRTPQRDPDDADLALLGWVLGADGLLTYDQKAFGGLVTTLEKKGEHGMYLCAFRDDLRVQETITQMVGVPLTLLTTMATEASGALKKRGVSYAAQGAAALAAVVGLALWPRGRAAVGDALTRYWTFTGTLNPAPEVTRQITAATARVAPAWPATDDPVVLSARRLVRGREAMTCTELVQTLKLSLSAGELFTRLQGHPGLFELHPGRRWTIRRSPASPSPGG